MCTYERNAPQREREKRAKQNEAWNELLWERLLTTSREDSVRALRAALGLRERERSANVRERALS